MFKRFFTLGTLCLLVGVSASASAGESSVKNNTRTEAGAVNIQDIEQKSYMPYPIWLVEAKRQQDGKPMLSAVFPIFMDRKADGSWKLMDSKTAKEWFNALSQSPLDGCPVEENTLDTGVAYKPEAEFFLSRTSQKSGALEIEAGSEKQTGTLEKGCASFGKAGSPARFSSFQKIQNIKITGLKSSPLSISIPQDLYPHLLIRYQKGQMLPIPARLDTLVFDPDHQRLYFTFRATALLTAPIRKLEYRMVGPDSWAKDSDTENREASLARAQGMRAYLDQCPLPKPCWAGEVCADPKRAIDMQALGRALGIFPADPSSENLRGPDTNTTRSKP